MPRILFWRIKVGRIGIDDPCEMGILRKHNFYMSQIDSIHPMKYCKRALVHSYHSNIIHTSIHKPRCQCQRRLVGLRQSTPKIPKIPSKCHFLVILLPLIMTLSQHGSSNSDARLASISRYSGRCGITILPKQRPRQPSDPNPSRPLYLPQCHAS